MSLHVYAFANSSAPREVATPETVADAKAIVARRIEVLVQELRAMNISPRVLLGHVHNEPGDFIQIFAEDREGAHLYYAIAYTERVLA